MRVLERQDERPLVGQGAERARKGGMEAAPERLGLETGHLLRNAGQTEQAGEERNRGRGPCALQSFREAAQRLFRLVLTSDSREGANEFSVRPVSERRSVGQAARLEPP